MPFVPAILMCPCQNICNLTAALHDVQVMFLFTDSHVANEGFLELINNMLTSGMIPALYEDAEKDALITGIREQVHIS